MATIRQLKAENYRLQVVGCKLFVPFRYNQPMHHPAIRRALTIAARAAAAAAARAA